jgi:hypothetical protein
MAKDKEWLEVVKKLTSLIVRMESKILIPAPFSPLK